MAYDGDGGVAVEYIEQEEKNKNVYIEKRRGVERKMGKNC